MVKMLWVATVSAFLSAAGGTLLAHHAFSAEFDAKTPVTLQGPITKVEWINPHAWIHMEVKKAGSKPEAVSFASSGSGGSGHLASELLATRAKAKMLHVPYKGNGPALLEVMAGRVDYMFYPVIGIADNVASKRLQILAVGTARRLPQFPDVPTMSEVGFPGFEETAPWVGLLAPAKTPPAIVNKLHDAMVKALAKPDVKAQLEKLGAVIVGNSPAEFSAYLKRDYERWEQVIKAAAIKPDTQ